VHKQKLKRAAVPKGLGLKNITNLDLLLLWLLLLFVVLVFKLRALHLLGSYSTA
jgi:hypothetical protein